MTAAETQTMRYRREVATAARPYVWISGWDIRDDQVEDAERERLTDAARQALAPIPEIKTVTLNLITPAR